jgi:nucleotide-binding universal stress UspA family protein
VRIVLGVDGSRQTALAVNAVAARDWPSGTEVKVITVLDRSFWTALANPQSSAWGWMVEVEQDGRAWAMKAVQNVEEELRAAGLTTTSLVVEGDPKKVLMEEAQRWQADCIFVGAKGLGAIERLVLGSVSSAVAARAHCSVEVVRQG